MAAVTRMPLTLRDLLAGESLLPDTSAALLDRVPTDLTDDGRQVRPGALFLARGGSLEQRRDRMAQATAAGALAVLVEADLGIPGSITLPRDTPRVALAPGVRLDQPLAGRVAERFFGHPARALRLVGITGTNGKTTTAMLTAHLLRAAGWKSGLIGTVCIDVGAPEGPRPAELTTPGAIELSRILAQMVAHGCQAAVMEVSSHALDQGRTAALPFTAAVFTNLTGDHLDYHGTMDAYAAAKARLFAGLAPDATAIVNAEDPFAERMLADTRARIVRTTLSPAPQASDTDWSAQILQAAADRSRVRWQGPPPVGTVETSLPLAGRFNVANALGALAAAHAVFATATTAVVGPEALTDLPGGVPGRLEAVRVSDTQPVVLVDYAHTHDALANVLTVLRPLTPGRLIVLAGCGGDRDRTKRPKMAAIACQMADWVVLTSDNPRSEDPQVILADMQRGVPAGFSSLSVVPDRATAIAMAIAAARPGDTVLLAGKGHEDYQILADPPGCYGGATRKIHFDDREEARRALQRGPEAGAALDAPVA